MAVISDNPANIPGVSGARRLVFTTAADLPLVAAQGVGRTIRVLGVAISATASSMFSLDDDVGVLFGPLAVGANVGASVIIPPTQVTLCETAANDALTISLSATDTTTGTIWYVVS